MGVVFGSQPEVARDRLICEFDNIFTGTKQFDDNERKVEKTERVGRFLFYQEIRKRLRIRYRWKL
jgi:hypothetical protein